MSPEDIARDFVACSGWAWQEFMGWETEEHPGEWPWGRYIEGGFVEMDERNPWEPSGWDVVPTLDETTLAIIAHVLLPMRWPGHSVQVETFPDGTARVLVFPSRPGELRVTIGRPVFRISHEPVAESLLACLQAAPGEAAS